jgi:hypothetical protein
MQCLLALPWLTVHTWILFLYQEEYDDMRSSGNGIGTLQVRMHDVKEIELEMKTSVSSKMDGSGGVSKAESKHSNCSLDGAGGDAQELLLMVGSLMAAAGEGTQQRAFAITVMQAAIDRLSAPSESVQQQHEAEGVAKAKETAAEEEAAELRRQLDNLRGQAAEEIQEREEAEANDNGDNGDTKDASKKGLDANPLHVKQQLGAPSTKATV